MLTADEIATLEALLARARHALGVDLAAIRDTITVGDIVQLRPGADPHWQTSVLLVCRVHDDGALSGQILRPHRGGVQQAWYTYRPPALARIGRMPFPEPPVNIRSWAYSGNECPICGKAKCPISGSPRILRLARK